jgi:hypothetical protein
MGEQNHSGNYDHVRCRTCGAAWLAGINERTGEMEPGHPADVPCSRNRSTDIAPPWVADALARHELAATASNLPAVADDAEIARREVAGGVPTREWPEVAGIPPGEFLAAVMAQANGKDGAEHA